MYSACPTVKRQATAVVEERCMMHVSEQRVLE
jgi:hypothetical protein